MLCLHIRVRCNSYAKYEAINIEWNERRETTEINSISMNGVYSRPFALVSSKQQNELDRVRLFFTRLNRIWRLCEYDKKTRNADVDTFKQNNLFNTCACMCYHIVNTMARPMRQPTIQCEQQSNAYWQRSRQPKDHRNGIEKIPSHELR